MRFQVKHQSSELLFRLIGKPIVFDYLFVTEMKCCDRHVVEHLIMYLIHILIENKSLTLQNVIQKRVV